MAAKSGPAYKFAVINSLRRFRDRYFPYTDKVIKDGIPPVKDAAEPCQPGYLDNLPVRLRLITFFFKFFNIEVDIRSVCRIYFILYILLSE